MDTDKVMNILNIKVMAGVNTHTGILLPVFFT